MSSWKTMALIKNLSNDEEGSENVAKKINMRPFKLFRVNLDPFNFSNVRRFRLELNS